MNPLVEALEEKGFNVEVIGASPVMLDAIETENEEMKRDGSIYGYTDERYDEFEPGGGSALDEGVEICVTFENGDEKYFCTCGDGYLMQDKPFDIEDAPNFDDASEEMSLDEVCEECEAYREDYVDVPEDDDDPAVGD